MTGQRTTKKGGVHGRYLVMQFQKCRLVNRALARGQMRLKIAGK